jgi:tRNA(Ile)-lysidine synthase
VSRESLLNYATEHGLVWAEDPSNSETHFDRNFLRQHVLPLLESRFPSTSVRLARSAALQAESQSILDAVAESDLASAGADPARLSIAALCNLPPARRSNLLRACLRKLRLGEPGFARLQTILTDFLAARPDAEPLVQWDSGEARCYRGFIYLLAREATPAPGEMHFSGDAIADLGANGCLCLQPSGGVGLDPRYCEQGLEIRYRVGGERLRPVGDSHERTLKSLFQAHAIVPWMRNRVPLVFAGGQLLAVADLWLSQEYCAQNGLQPVWKDRPSLH